MIRFTTVLIFSVLLAPSGVFAAVVINEIAWMGSADSTNDEWIELHNNGGSAVSLDGWMLTDTIALEIELAGTVGAGEFALLERTDDTSAPGSAFLIYTGALGNDGRTLTLRRSDNSIEDQVAGGENWENIGGDNTTKDTAQRTDAGWITARPTPARANETVSSPAPETESTREQTAVQGSDEDKKPEKISLVLPDTTLELSPVVPKIAYVNQGVAFDVVAEGIGPHLIESLQYSWNFGDTYTSEGKKVTHAFRHPGEYVVMLFASYARHSGTARHEITVLPTSFSISRTESGDVLIHNNARYEVDLSGFLVRGDRTITIPGGTILLPNATLTIERSRLESGVQKMIALYDGARILVASSMPMSVIGDEGSAATTTQAGESIEESPTTTAEGSSEMTLVLLAEEEEPFGSEEPPSEEEILEPLASLIARTGQSAQVGSPWVLGSALAAETVSAVPETKRNMLAYYGLVGVIILSILALYTTRKKEPHDLL